jgi:hypothetical protein
MSDHRWQGYSHHELFQQIHQGPGADASTDSIRRWTELARALGEIDTGMAAALTSAMADWQGEAAENAREGLRPLHEWAQQAQQAAEVMRQCAEHQADFVSRARADMPPPVTVTAEDPGEAVSLLTHLFGGQTDYETEEARHHAAEQRAFDVMRSYESSTTANTTSLASFNSPPRVVVDAPTAASGSGGTVGKQAVTISWVPTPAPAARAPGVATARGAAGRSGQHPTVSSDRPTPTSRSGANAATSKATREDEESIDRDVTEQFGHPNGLFDQEQHVSRPVIGGEPG